MGTAPDLQEAIKRFNQGCAAFERALAAARVVDLTRYEVESRSAFVDVVGALEWAVKYCLEQFYAETKTEKELEEADNETFERLLKRLARKARARFEPESTRALHAARRRRNLITHEASIAPYEELRKAFRVVRRFLNDHLPALEEQLSSLALETSSGHEAPPVPARSAVLRPAHRQEECDAWLDRTFREGLQRLRQGRAQHYDATIASLEIEAREALTRHALNLLEMARRPSDPLERLSEHTEAQVKELLLRSRDKGVSPEDADRLLQLIPLINRYPALCLEAGWLHLDEEQRLRFKDTCLPALLVGRHLARSGAEADSFRHHVGRERSWAEAAWMAVSSGDDLASWARHLLAERDPLLLLERVVVTCAAFGAAPHGTAASDEMAKAFHLCVAALVAFAPRWVEDPPQEQLPAWAQRLERRRFHDPDSPWFLPVEFWRQCVMDLADASWVLGESLAGSRRETWPSAPHPLADVLSSLGLSARLSPVEVSALAALCAPFLATRDGLLEGPFFQQVFSVNTRVGVLVAEPFLEAWIQSHGIRALKETNRPETLRALAIPGDSHAAGYLLNRAGLILDWHTAWTRVTSTWPKEAVPGWVEAIQRLSSLDDSSPSLRQLMLEDSLLRLSDLGLRSQALKALREACLARPYTVDADGEQHKTQVAILRLLEFTDSEWSHHIELWTEKPALGWRTLLAAGAPQASIARWCVQKLLQREQAPEAYRHGPVGILGHNLQVLSSGPWQFAFQQAQEALTWLLEEGDASALSVLAEACLTRAIHPDRFDPPMVKLETNVFIPLSMVLWPRVVHRPAGREAFYVQVERDASLGEMFFSGQASFPDLDESDLWALVAVQVWKPQMLASTMSPPPPMPPERKTEARRLLTCFEQRMSNLWITESRWPLAKELFERKGWPPPPHFPWRVPIGGYPWEYPWPGVETQAVILASAAAYGVDVAAPLATLFLRLKSIPAPGIANLSQVLGHALSQLSEYLPERAADVLEQALSPEVLRSMCNDDSSAFWDSLLRKHGSARVLAMLDPLEPVDCGLGLVDALTELDIQTLRERELRPELLRPLLIRASKGGYVPSGRFWEEAWRVARSPAEIPELPHLAAGPWLEELLTQSKDWEPGARQHLLRHLAGFSTHDEVRRRCIATLLQMRAGGTLSS